MNVGDVMDELGTALGAIEGLRVFPYWPDNITPPTAIVGWPDPVTYDVTFARGADQIALPVYVLVSRGNPRTARDLLSVYVDGSGDKSVKAALDNGTYTACDSVRVQSATVEQVTVSAIDYLAAVFQVDIIGRGA